MTTDTRPGLPAERVFRAWQDGLSALFRGNGQPVAPMAGLWGAGADFAPLREAWERVAGSAREVTNAQLSLAGEWLRLPLTLAQPGGANGLQAGYTRLFEAFNELFTAWAAAAMAPLQTSASAAPAAPAPSETPVAQPQQTALTAKADAVPTVGEAAPAPSGSVNGNVQRPVEAPHGALEQAIAVAERAAERATDAATEAAPASTQAPLPFKGKITRKGERVYHKPGQANYDRFEADVLFETEEQAQDAGYRAAQR